MYSVLQKRIDKWSESKKALVEEQGGFREGRGTPDQVFSLVEMVRARAGMKTYCCFIDVRKAFDRVWRAGLWKQMWDIGVRGKMWRVVKNMYEEVVSCVKVGSDRTDWFGLDVGVRQGCVLSPILCSIFIDGLAKELKKCRGGVRVDGLPVLLLLYADDIVLIAKNRRELQKMLDVVTEYSRRWRFELNKKKSQVVIFGGKAEEAAFSLGGAQIKTVEEYKYLGMEMQAGRMWKKFKKSRLMKARMARVKAWSMALRAGIVSVKSGVRIWESLVRPVIEFGSEVWGTEGDDDWREAEAEQRRMARIILGCSEKTANEVVLGELGWQTIKGRRWAIRLTYWGKLVCMADSRLAKRIYNESRRRYENDGTTNWCSYTHRMMTELKLEGVWERGSLGGMTMAAWKMLVSTQVEEWEEKRWREGIERKPKLANYAKWKLTKGMEGYLTSGDIAEGVRMITRLRGGSNMLKLDQGRKEGLRREDRVCEVCGQEVEDEEHFMLRCVRYRMGRRIMMREVGEVMEETKKWLREGNWEKLMQVLLGEGGGAKRAEIMEIVKVYTRWAAHTRRKTLQMVG